MAKSAEMDLEQIFGWAGFFVALGVLATPALTAYKMLRAGTVGSMTITFFLFVFMNCINMTTYGILTSNLQLMMCNMYGICSATFAIRTYLSLLSERVTWHKTQKTVVGAMGTMGSTGPPSSPQLTDPATSAASPLPIRIRDVEAAASPTSESINETLANNAIEAEAALERTVKQTMLFLGVDITIIIMVVILTLFEFPAYASSLCGLAATAMGTIMFSGPLDQIGWILKNKSSAPLEPMIMLAAAANSICWGAYGLITLDIWLIFPNTCGLLLAIIQALLLMWFPRNSAADAISKRNVDAKAIDRMHEGDGRGGGTVSLDDLDRVVAEAMQPTRPTFVST